MTVSPPISDSMRRALDALPLEARRTSRGWAKPVGSPSKVTLDALIACRLVRFTPAQDDQPPRWERV